MTDHVAAACPTCSPAARTAHEVLKPGGRTTVRCVDCGHVHKTRIEEDREVTVDVVVSQDGESFPTTVEAPAEETVAVGEEFVVETETAIVTARITDVQVDDQRRGDSASVEDVETLWTRDVGNVAVNATVHPRSDGRAPPQSRSVDVHVPGDFEFEVGGEVSIGDDRLVVEGIVLRDTAVGYDHEQLDYEGDSAAAKDVKRLYAREQDR
ncbi:hypothetical protein BRD17_06085 [Halobacteriales archaeon SW_7_68_16]|nr:MAG: hypothetical protein BRD17_06085 [Halobacteriales archaeon SW_7_68_16]